MATKGCQFIKLAVVVYQQVLSHRDCSERFRSLADIRN
jgi:hypothetical protein